MFKIDNSFLNTVSIEDIALSKDHVFNISDEDDGIVAAIVPEPLAEDFNLPFSSAFEAAAWIVFVRENHVSGKEWELEDPLAIVHILWDEFGNVSINENDEIEDNFLHFERFTSRFEVWEWFETTFDVSVTSLN